MARKSVRRARPILGAYDSLESRRLVDRMNEVPDEEGVYRWFVMVFASLGGLWLGFGLHFVVGQLGWGVWWASIATFIYAFVRFARASWRWRRAINDLEFYLDTHPVGGRR